MEDIEWQIWVIKESERVIWSHFLFNKVPGRITIELIVFMVLWLNAFLTARGALRMYSPLSIVTG